MKGKGWKTRSHSEWVKRGGRGFLAEIEKEEPEEGRKLPASSQTLFPETPRNERSRALLTRLLFDAGGVLASQHCLPSVADSLLHPPPSPGWRARRDCQAGRQSGCTVGMPVPSLPPSRSSNVTAAPAAAARILGWDCAASLH